jgi:hypothetical protein
MSDLNPFFHRGPVRDPAYFFGRTRAVAFVTELLHQGQSIALHGQRRFGKTSLLFYVSHPQVTQAHGLGADTTRWVYLDGGALDGLDEEWFYGAIDRALGGDADVALYARFIERLRELAAQQLRLVVMLDEFELVAANPRFGATLFNHLRGLAAQYPLQFITASKDPLLQVTFAHPDTLSSPFFNIFAPLHLSLFSEADARHLLATLAERAGHPFSDEIIAFVLNLVGTHPLFLQVAGYRAFGVGQIANLPADVVGQIANLSYIRTQIDNLPADVVGQIANLSYIRAQIFADLEAHLQYYWSKLDADAQYTLAALPLFNRDARPPIVQRLITSGLLRDNGAYLGEVLQEFVRRQTLEGLLQSEPFIMDVRRNLVAANGQPVHLTPTEFAALKLFLERAGQLLTPEDIERALWTQEVVVDPERARNIVKKLRAALGEAGEAIVNRRGQGWVLVIGN